MSLLGFSNAPPRQDFIVLGGYASPGVCEFIGPPNSPRRWDERQGYGYSGSVIVYTGDGLGKFRVAFSLWDDPITPTTSQWTDWADFANAVLAKPPKGSRPQALRIDHPALSLPPINITSVVVEDVTGFVQDERGLWTCTVDFKEYRAPLPVLGKVQNAIPSVKKPIPTAQDAADVAIQQLTKEFLELKK